MHWVSSAFLSNGTFPIIACWTIQIGTLSQFLDWHITFSTLAPMGKDSSSKSNNIGPLIELIYDPRTAHNTTYLLGLWYWGRQENNKAHRSLGLHLGSYSEIE